VKSALAFADGGSFQPAMRFFVAKNIVRRSQVLTRHCGPRERLGVRQLALYKLVMGLLYKRNPPRAPAAVSYALLDYKVNSGYDFVRHIPRPRSGASSYLPSSA